MMKKKVIGFSVAALALGGALFGALGVQAADTATVGYNQSAVIDKNNNKANVFLNGVGGGVDVWQTGVTPYTTKATLTCNDGSTIGPVTDTPNYYVWDGDINLYCGFLVQGLSVEGAFL